MRTSLLLLALGLAGCASTDPLTRPGLWHPTGANEANLAAMIDDPQDLVRGRSAEDSDGQMAAAAVSRLRAGKVKGLPASGIARFNVQEAPAGAGATDAAPATGAVP